jgi:hypothetical protein
VVAAAAGQIGQGQERGRVVRLALHALGEDLLGEDRRKKRPFGLTRKTLITSVLSTTPTYMPKLSLYVFSPLRTSTPSWKPPDIAS